MSYYYFSATSAPFLNLASRVLMHMFVDLKIQNNACQWEHSLYSITSLLLHQFLFEWVRFKFPSFLMSQKIRLDWKRGVPNSSQTFTIWDRISCFCVAFGLRIFTYILHWKKELFYSERKWKIEEKKAHFVLFNLQQPHKHIQQYYPGNKVEKYYSGDFNGTAVWVKSQTYILTDLILSFQCFWWKLTLSIGQTLLKNKDHLLIYC